MSHLCFTAVLCTRSALSCCINDNKTCCWRMHFPSLNTSCGSTLSQMYVTKVKSEADKACWKATSMFPFATSCCIWDRWTCLQTKSIASFRTVISPFTLLFLTRQKFLFIVPHLHEQFEFSQKISINKNLF